MRVDSQALSQARHSEQTVGVPLSAGDRSMNLLHASRVEKCAKKPTLLAVMTATLEYLGRAHGSDCTSSQYYELFSGREGNEGGKHVNGGKRHYNGPRGILEGKSGPTTHRMRMKSKHC